MFSFDLKFCTCFLSIWSFVYTCCLNVHDMYTHSSNLRDDFKIERHDIHETSIERTFTKFKLRDIMYRSPTTCTKLQIEREHVQNLKLRDTTYTKVQY